MSCSELGSFYHRFHEKDLPTGTFTAHFETAPSGERLGQVSFRVEAYRVPRFEVRLHGPDTASLDRAFEVSLTATYYAGGKVGGQPVAWRVTQFPYAWTPKKQPGFQYSSDARFSRGGRFQASPTLEKQDATSEAGSATLRLDPTVEQTAQPRSYVVEATVTGPDDQTVTATRSFPALPPVRARRQGAALPAARPTDRPRDRGPGTGRRAARGQAGHRAPAPARVALAAAGERLQRRPGALHDRRRRREAGGADAHQRQAAARACRSRSTVPASTWSRSKAATRSGATQVVSVDLYAGGDEPMTWAKPVTRVFSVATDKPRYDPGATAALVLQSPFQNARALAVVEAPERNEYRWIDVVGGAATFSLPIQGNWAPAHPGPLRADARSRARHGAAARQQHGPRQAGDDGRDRVARGEPGRPPAAGRRCGYPESARPGQTIEVSISLKDPSGKPLAGEATLWLVDEAVLALGKEQRLDPVPDFVTPVRSHLSLHDTRNMAFGQLPLLENPGGDQGEEPGLLERTTVRRNFKSVPYYNPAIVIGPDGTATVSVKLSDDLTNFALRAKAVSGPERLGFGTGRLPVRLPVIVQPALPRFVRPGDRFVAAAIGRIVEGKGGPGSAEMKVEGATLEAPGRKTLTWVEGRPERIEFPVQVETPPLGADGRPSYGAVTFRAAVARSGGRSRRRVRGPAAGQAGPRARGAAGAAGPRGRQAARARCHRRAGACRHPAAGASCSRTSRVSCAWRPASTTCSAIPTAAPSSSCRGRAPTSPCAASATCCSRRAARPTSRAP